MVRILLILGLIAGLAGCTSLAPKAPPQAALSWQERQTILNRLQSWQLNGKIAVQTPQDSGSATVDWMQSNSRYAVSLYGPLGTNGLKLSGQPGSVTLVMSDGKRYTANNPDELLAKRWGFHLPVSYLHYWIRGLPVPSLPSNSQFDASHRLVSLTQQGWQVQFLSYMSNGIIDLPEKLVITSSSLKVKIIVYRWN